MRELINRLNQILEGNRDDQAISIAKELERKHLNNEIAINADLMEVFETLALIEADGEYKELIRLYNLKNESLNLIENRFGKTFKAENAVIRISSNLKNLYVAEYRFGAISVNADRTNETDLFIMIHEIGHYIHDIVFGDKTFRFPTEGMSPYARRNNRENFAECFKDAIIPPTFGNVAKRTARMESILAVA